jgi:hypothetical protein
MAVTGKTGADAIAKAVEHICRLVTKYHDKLAGVIDGAHAAGVIDATQQALAHAFIDGAQAACTVWKLIAGFSGF